jgi:hypothetical protein
MEKKESSSSETLSLSVMAGLGPAIHAFARDKKKGVDTRTKCGHGE